MPMCGTRSLMAASAHILVVDDHAEIRHSVTRYLEKNGLRATGAKSAGEMDARLSEDKFDLIVLDVMMPGEDGLTACKRLRQECGTPVLMLTALGEDDDRIEGLEGGADDYLSKPFNPRELLARIRAIMRRSEKSPPQDGVVTLTRRICKLASCSLIKRPVPRISTPRMLRADGSGW